MKLISPTDSLFLIGESREHPMHVAGLQLFEPPADGGPDFIRELHEAILRGDDAESADVRLAEGVPALLPRPVSGFVGRRGELDALDALLADPSRLDAMSTAARTLGRPDATASFADLVEASMAKGGASAG